MINRIYNPLARILYTDLDLKNIDAGGTQEPAPTPPTPITYLTQWKIVGNSEVHTDPYLTSWKVSGNSVVQDGVILSCGDLGQDGKYHVKISNGVTIYDIPLDAPLRKVNDVADTIEFPSSVDGKALVTRKNIFIQKSFNNGYFDSSGTVFFSASISNDIVSLSYGDRFTISICNKLETRYYAEMRNANIVAMGTYNGAAVFRNHEIEQTADAYKAWLATLGELDLICQLTTPTTELVDATQIAVSPTDTYTSANVVPFSAFAHTENKEIWSCGEYNATDGKYHILVQPQGGSIADIALDEPLRKVNNVADTIEFPSSTEGKALVTRKIFYDTLDKGSWTYSSYSGLIANTSWMSKIKVLSNNIQPNVIAEGFTTYSYDKLRDNKTDYGLATVSGNSNIVIYASSFVDDGDTTQALSDYLVNKHFIAELKTPTTELIDAPQIEEADSYSMVISQGGKAISWSSFSTE